MEEIEQKVNEIDKILDLFKLQAQDLLTSCWILLGYEPFNDEVALSKKQVLKELCQLLTDYVATSTFSIMDKLDQIHKNDYKLDMDILKFVEDFNEKYSGGSYAI